MKVEAFKFNTAKQIAELGFQLQGCRNVRGKQREFVKAFLLRRGIFSIEGITDQVKRDFRRFVYMQPDFNQVKKANYAASLEMIQFSYYSPLYEGFLKEIEDGKKPDAVIRKVEVFLMSHGILSAEDITYEVRKSYQDYLKETIASSKVNEYVKALDNIKLSAIKRACDKTPFLEKGLKYTEGKIFLLYHPDYEIANTFYFTQNKDELLFDFSLPAKETVKYQIFRMLNFVLEQKQKTRNYRKNRRELYLVPLKLLYEFCIEQQIEDIEMLEEKDIFQFREKLSGLSVDKVDEYIQVIDGIRKFLFIQAESTNWNANVWYLERFCLKSYRMNPANPVVSISFLKVLDKENRKLFQQYMKYLIGLSSLAISNVHARFYRVSEFLQYCDQKGLSVSKLPPQHMKDYFKFIDEQRDMQAHTFNRKVVDINKFFQYLKGKKYIEQVPFKPQRFYKKELPVHCDRALPEAVIDDLLKRLTVFPEHLRLMLLHLSEVGLRLNEVCTLKGDAYYQQNGESWIRVYQYKMRREKTVPIPTTLYELMSVYIGKQNIGADDYVFHSKKGGAYRTGTFTKQIKKIVPTLNIDFGQYGFRSHDFRHSLITALYDNGASLQAVRDIAGHRTEEMSKQYVDDRQKKADAVKKEYFSNKKHCLANTIRKEKEYES